jgi:hypothetical protein
VVVVCSEHRLGDVLLVHQHLMVAAAEIQQLIDNQDGKLVLHHLGI